MGSCVAFPVRLRELPTEEIVLRSVGGLSGSPLVMSLVPFPRRGVPGSFLETGFLRGGVEIILLSVLGGFGVLIPGGVVRLLVGPVIGQRPGTRTAPAFLHPAVGSSMVLGTSVFLVVEEGRGDPAVNVAITVTVTIAITMTVTVAGGAGVHGGLQPGKLGL